MPDNILKPRTYHDDIPETPAIQITGKLPYITLVLILVLGISGSIFGIRIYQRIGVLESTILDLNSEMNTKTVNLKSDISALTTDISLSKLSIEIKDSLDFNDSRCQYLDHGFMLADATQTKQSSGIKYTGRIINTKSITHSNVRFKLIAARVAKEFTIKKIADGKSKKFSVYVPNVKLKDARYVKIEYVGSNIGYN